MWRVFHRLTATPVVRMAAVMPKDRLAGNFSQSSQSAMNNFDPMKINSTDSAYFR